MLTRETQSPCHWGVFRSPLGFFSLLLCGYWSGTKFPRFSSRSFYVLCFFWVSKQLVSPDSPKVYKFSMWFWNTNWPSLVQEETRRGNTMDRPQSTWLVPTSVVILLSWLALESREHVCWELSYCLRGFAQKRHSGFSFSSKTTSTSHHQCPESLGIKRSSHVTSCTVTIHPILTSQTWAGCSDCFFLSEWEMERNQPPCFCCQYCTRAVSAFPKMFCLPLLSSLCISHNELTIPFYTSTKLYSKFCRGGSNVSTFIYKYHTNGL